MPGVPKGAYLSSSYKPSGEMCRVKMLTIHRGGGVVVKEFSLKSVQNRPVKCAAQNRGKNLRRQAVSRGCLRRENESAGVLPGLVLFWSAQRASGAGVGATNVSGSAGVMDGVERGG